MGIFKTFGGILGQWAFSRHVGEFWVGAHFGAFWGNGHFQGILEHSGHFQGTFGHSGPTGICKAFWGILGPGQGAFRGILGQWAFSRHSGPMRILKAF
jgi:hypothetical protein